MRESPFSFVPASLEEVSSLAEFLIEGFLEEWKDNPEFPRPEREKVEEELEALICTGSLIKMVNNNVLIGVYGSAIRQIYWWSSKEVLTNVVFYIKPEFRSFNNYSRMLSMAEEFAKINAVPLEISFFGTSVDRKTNAVLHRGYKTLTWSVIKCH